MPRTPSIHPSRHAGLRALVLAIGVSLSALLFTSAAAAVTFNPNLVISDDNMRAYDNYSAADVQAFLVSNHSALATRSFRRHDRGRIAPASTIIYEAARAHRLSPKVLLVMLQKEQSLITYSGSDAALLAYKFDWAIGMGVPDGSARNQRYRGFGNQLWYGARRLDSYGERKYGSTVPRWKPGLANGYTPRGVRTGNISTYKLYVYNPSIGAKKPYPSETTTGAAANSLSGNANFWLIHWRWFGNPFGAPVVRPVFSFTDRKSGSAIYTTSSAQRYSMLRSPKSYRYTGRLTSVNTSGGVNPTPVYKFRIRKSGAYIYTISETVKRQWLARSKKLQYRGVAFTASTDPAGRPVYRFTSKKNGGHVLVASEAVKRRYLSKSYRKKWRYQGVAFYLQP